MTQRIHARTTCRLCLSPRLSGALKLASTPVGEGYVPRESLDVPQEVYPVEINLCSACGHVQLSHVIDPSVLYGQYIYKTTHSMGLVQHFDRYAEWALSRNPMPPGALVVDLGSNDGSLLKAFKARGMKVIGVDPATKIAAEATAAGIPTYPNFFTAPLAQRIVQEHGRASIITMNNAFANIDDLHEIVRGVGELLAPDGVFIFETGYLLDVVQKVIFDNIYDEHLSYFAVTPARAFLAANGLELIDAHRVPTKGGSIRCSAQRARGPRPVSPTVAAQVQMEADVDLFDLETYRTLERRIRQMAEETRGRIQRLKAKGRRIAGYGASVTVTGVLFNFGLDRSLIDYLVDDNPVRHGLHSPGMHIPVFPSDRLTSDRPDYVIILAWQYAQPIMARQQKYLENGGRFLLFQPYVRTVGRENAEGFL
jgi:SAM-dependent methyltransferase